MRLVLSRKGFDSSAASGGCPSPILPDGQMLSLPVPHDGGRVRYSELRPRGLDVGHIVSDLTKNQLSAGKPAHLDPDLEPPSRKRRAGWLPAFGQDSVAQRHLEREGVGIGDRFLFFGWFKEVELVRRRYRYVANAPDVHVFLGWLRVGEVLRLGPDRIPPWLLDHPHAVRNCSPHNTVHVSKGSRGAGVFSTFDSRSGVRLEPQRIHGRPAVG
jgi:Nucleotide modification associated domain 3